MSLAELDPTSRLLVETVLRHGPISRAAMTRRTGLSSGSLTRVTAPLVGAGILKEGASRRARVGRPALPLEAVDSAARFVGVKVVPGRLYAVLAGLCGVVHGSAVEDADTSSVESTAAAIAGLLDQRAGTWTPEALGVSIAGAVDPFGTVRAARLLGWSGGNITGAVTTATGLSCAAANDVDALTLAEHWFGRGRGAHNFVVLTVGVGVGAGAVVEDRLLLGHQGSAGMLGAAWASDGRRFREMLATEPLLERACAAAGRPLTEADLRGDDPVVGGVLDEAAEALGELVGLAKLAWGPERVLITGDGIAPFVPRLPAIQRGLERHRYYDIEPPEVQMGDTLDFLSWARGGAALAIRASLQLR
ncbi:MAG: ROK family protein [Propioniciclava sp.]|uniref:ROK family protein n=1 Tax=Propioniciclava sp. TaxID=2038686 RepID=UPI0039E71E84